MMRAFAASIAFAFLLCVTAAVLMGVTLAAGQHLLFAGASLALVLAGVQLALTIERMNREDERRALGPSDFEETRDQVAIEAEEFGWRRSAPDDGPDGGGSAMSERAFPGRAFPERPADGSWPTHSPAAWHGVGGPREGCVALSFYVQGNREIIRLLVSEADAAAIADVIVGNQRARTNVQSDRSSGSPIREGSPIEGQQPVPSTSASSAAEGE